MRYSLWVLAIWGSISIFTQTDIFPRAGDKKLSEIHEIIEKQIQKICLNSPSAEVCQLLKTKENSKD